VLLTSSRACCRCGGSGRIEAAGPAGDGGGKWIIEYDEQRRIVSVQPAGPPGRVVTYKYDAAGDVITADEVR
jgi:hypothetical protein